MWELSNQLPFFKKCFSVEPPYNNILRSSVHSIKYCNILQIFGLSMGLFGDSSKGVFTELWCLIVAVEWSMPLCVPFLVCSYFGLLPLQNFKSRLMPLICIHAGSTLSWRSQCWSLYRISHLNIGYLLLTLHGPQLRSEAKWSLICFLWPKTPRQMACARGPLRFVCEIYAWQRLSPRLTAAGVYSTSNNA